jgi:mono/diheme cytochrome c family protein
MTTRAILALAAIAAMSLGAMPASAEAGDEGDAFRGNAYAQGMCMSCHAIGDSTASATPGAAPFKQIKLQQKDAATFEAWMNKDHPLISGRVLNEHQSADLFAYINSLSAEKK